MVLIKDNGAEVTVKRKILILDIIALYCSCFIDVLFSCRKLSVHSSTPYESPFLFYINYSLLSSDLLFMSACVSICFYACVV